MHIQFKSSQKTAPLASLIIDSVEQACLSGDYPVALKLLKTLENYLFPAGLPPYNEAACEADLLSRAYQAL
jgi:hypothetical protein